MAKQKINSGELNLDEELDIPNFDFDFGDVPDNRSPETKILSGIADGVTSTFRNTGFIRRLMREALPPVYGEVADTVNIVGNNTSQLYNKAVREVKPSIAQVAKATQNLIPKKFKRSKDALESIKEWAEGFKSSQFTSADREEIRSRNITLELGDVFSAMAKNQEEQYQETVAKDAIKESIDIARQKDNNSILSGISRGVQSLTMYQDKVTQAYQKKSLELQYRSYFSQIDLVEESKKLFALQETSFKAISKNTALPEFVKIRDSERFKELLKDKMNESIFGSTTSFFSKTFKNTGNKLKEYTNTFKDVAGNAAMGLEGAGMVSDLGNNTDWRETLASGGASLAVEQLALKYGRKGRKALEAMPMVKKIVENTKYGLNNIPETVSDWTNSSNFTDPWYKTAGKGILRDLVGNQKPSTSIENDRVNNGLEPAVFNNRNSKSLNEIIPGYLARILREIQVFRTGDESIDLVSYDPYKNRFEGSDKVKKSFMDRLIPKGAVASHQDISEDIFKLIDPNNEIPQEQRDAVMDVLTERKFNKKTLSAKRLTGKSFYSDNDDRLSEDDSEKIAKVFDRYFSDRSSGDDFKTKRNRLDNVTNRIGKSLNNPSSEIQKLVNLGYTGQLREMGLLEEGGDSINMDEVLKKFTSKSKDDNSLRNSILSTVASISNPNVLNRNNPTGGTNSNLDLEKAIDRVTDKLVENSDTLKSFLESSRDHQRDFNSFIKTNVETLVKIDETLVATNEHSETKTTNTILTRIEEFLVEKLPVLFAQSVSQGGGGGFNNPEAEGYRKDTLFNNLTGLIGKTSSIAWNKIVKPINKLAWGATKLGTKLSMKSLKLGAGTALKSTNWLANKLVKSKDIFVEGEVTPRMKMTGFRAGKYFDSKTNEPIKNIYDLEKLEGDVIDQTGNIVLSRDEISKAYVKDIKGNGILSLGKYVGGKLLDLSKFTTNTTFAGARMIFGAANAVRKTALSLLDQPIDIYLKGEDKPIMLAVVMRNGGYISEGTGKPITRPSLIDGPIKDLKGNYVLTSEQLRQGLEDINGKPIRSPLMKLLGFGAGIVKGGIKGIFRASKFVTDVMKGGLTGAGNFMQGMLDSLNGGTGGKRSIEVLEQIRNLLDDRLPKTPSTSFNDRDGDGDRDGSWKDMFSNKENGEDKESKSDSERIDTTIRPGRENTFDKLQRLAGTAKDKVLGMFGMGDDDEDEDGVDVDGDPGDRRRRRGRRRGKAGKLKRLRNLGTKRGALGALGKVVGGVGKYGLMGAGALAKGGLGLLAGGLPMLGSAIGAAGGAIGAAAGAIPAILGGIGAVVSSPIVLGAVAIGAAGYGAYKAYQYFTKKEYSYLVKMRMAQYGLSIDQMKQFPIVLALEDKLTKYVKTTDGSVDFNMDDVLVTELIKMFEINPEDTNPKNNILIKNWLDWFTYRFKPVYSAHLTALKKLNIKNSLVDVDNIPAKEKELYIGIARKADVQYGTRISPFPDAKLEAGEQLVNAYADEAMKETQEQIKKDQNDPSKASKEKVSVEGALVAAGATNLSSADKAKATTSLGSTKPPEQSGWFASKLKDTLNKLKTPTGLMLLTSPFAALASYAIKGTGGIVMEFLGFSVTALEAVRFKAYGIKDMERSKVSSIRKLEKELLDKVSFNGEGIAFYNESAEYVLNKIGSEFGITDANSPATSKWMTWFQQRFLPVFLNYLGLVKQSIGSSKAELDDSRIPAQTKLDIAKKLAATMGVWVVKASPWLDVESSTDSNIVKENITYLEKQAKDKVLSEQKDNQKANLSSVAPLVKTGEDTIKPATNTNTGASPGTKPAPPIQESAASENNGKWDRVLANGNESKKFKAGNKFSKSNSFKGFGDDIDGHIKEASMKYGIDEGVLRGFVKMEAGWGNQMSPTGAIGVGQFTQGTWDALAKTEEGKAIGMTRIGDRFRTSEDPRYDKKINTLATALLAKQNSDLLKKKGLEPTGENLYMVHNIGPGFINAASGGKVNPATLKAMQLNGMKPGMTPEDFIAYQKKRFNSHFDTANGGSPADTITKPEASIPGAKAVEEVSGAKEAINIYKAAKERRDPTSSSSRSSSGMSSYAGSVEKTKPTPSVANVPQFRAEKLPEEIDDFATAMRKSRNMFARKPPSAADQQVIASNQLNNSMTDVSNTLSESLNVQREMLDRLNRVANGVEQLSSVPKQSKPETTQQNPPMQTASVKPGPARSSSSIPKAPINTARG